ncbi:MAG: TRAP transporter large permease [Burkholderiales bacterium]
MEVSLYGFLALFALAFLGVPLGYSMLLVGLAGFGVLRGSTPALSMMAQQVYDISTNYGFTVLPLFLLMGELIHRANLSDDLYSAGRAWLGHLRGGLAMATIVACGGFAAVCGSSLATAATMAKVAMPPMRRYGYSDSLGTGAIAAGGTLGIMIPPSVPLMIYGVLTETDVAKLFIAGVIPGLLLIVLFMAAIAVTTWLDPAAGPPAEAQPWAQRLRALRKIAAVVALFAAIFGGMYFGLFTPTEGAGIGAFGGFTILLVRGSWNWRVWGAALGDTAKTTGAVFVVAMGALVFGNFLNLAGLPDAMVGWIRSMDLSPLGVVLTICAIYLILGCVFDSLGMLLLTIPVFFPVVKSAGIDPIWFGIVVVLMIEVGLITPPVGMNVFVVKAVIPEVPTGRIFRGVWPFVGAMLLALVLLLAFPGLAVWLPSLM